MTTGETPTLTTPWKITGAKTPVVPDTPVVKTPVVVPTTVAPTSIVRPTAQPIKLPLLTPQTLPKPRKDLTQEDVVSDPEKLSSIRNYMVKRMGKQYEQSSDEEVVDTFVTHMRWVNTNELNTIGEARHVLAQDEPTRMAYGEAYKTYNDLGNFISSGDTLGGLYDYTTAILASPSTYVGGIIGRAASKAATTGLKKSLITATASATEAAVGKVAGKAAGAEARQIVVSAAVKRNAAITMGVAATVDGTIAGIGSNMYQKTMMETGVQDDYSLLETAIAVLGGAAGAGMAYASTVGKGATGLTDVAGKAAKAKRIRASRAKEAVVPELKAAVAKLAQDWDELATRGQAIDPSKFLRDSSIDWFFDWKNDDSFVRILQRNGADLDLSDDVPLSAQLTEFAAGLSQEARDSYTELLQPMGVSFSEMIDIFAGTVKEGAQNLNAASLAKQRLKDFQHVSVAKGKAAQDILADGMQEAGEEVLDKDTLGYLTSVWKRTLVAHPATTMMNVKGWAMNMAGRSIAETIHGSALQIVGRAKQLAGVKTAKLNLAQSSALFKSQWFMAKTLVDPYTSIEAFSELLFKAPKKFQKEALSTFFAGVEESNPARFGFDINTGVAKNVEKAVDFASKMSLVRIQDIYTKTFSGLKTLETLSRSEFGTGLSDLVNAGRSHEITDDMWNKTIKSLLKDTMSADYTKEGGLFLKGIAQLVEKASNTPGIGFVIPFGRFINNTMAFTMAYSPIGMIGAASKIYKEGFTMELSDKLARSVVGTTGLAMIAVNEGEKQAKGLQWYEEETNTGEVQNVQNLFPKGLYNLLGRMSYLYANGDGVPDDLWNDLSKQLGPLAAVQGISNNSVMLEISKYISDIRGDEEAETEIFGLIGTAITSITGTIFSGFTRPLDPLNDLVGAVGDMTGRISDVSIDKKIPTGVDAAIQSFGRYTNNFFSAMLGEPKVEGSNKVLYGTPLNSATEDRPVKDANPISRLVGAPMENPKTNIDILLGQTNFPPFKMDSFTGNPEYNSFINNQVFPILERKATAMLASDYYKSAPTHVRRSMVTKVLKDARDEVLDSLDQGFVGGADDRLVNERRKFSTLPESLRVEAKIALGITTGDRKLTPYQLEALNQWIEIEKGDQKAFLENK